MAKTTGPLFSGTASGTVGGHLDFVRVAGAAVVRCMSRIRANSRDGKTRAATPAQAAVRARWSLGIAAWHALTDGERASWNLAGEAVGITGFNYFQHLYEPIVHTVWDGGATTWDAGLTVFD